MTGCRIWNVAAETVAGCSTLSGYWMFIISRTLAVALSRMTSLEGLYLDSFESSKITVNKKAKDFYLSYHTFCYNVKQHSDNLKPFLEDLKTITEFQHALQKSSEIGYIKLTCYHSILSNEKYYMNL